MSLPRQRTFSALVAAFTIACTSPTATSSVDATVRFAATVEGGCWSLVTPTNKVYEPVDLPSAFRINGLAVRVALRDAPGWASTCMIGQLVHVESIQAR